MRVVITGAGGMLGRELVSRFQSSHCLPLTHGDLDVSDYRQVRERLEPLRPDLVIHTAALTDVDGCELQPDRAYAVNALGTENVALACQSVGAVMLYVSTNCVFAGDAGSPYREFDRPNPSNVYGRSKLAGEEALRGLLPRHYVVRTSWLFGLGRRNFVTTVLDLAATGKPLRIVDDEIGSPTYVPDLAAAIYDLIQSDRFGTYHLANEGFCSRFELARTVLASAGVATPIEKMALAAFSRPAPTPPFTPLHNFAAATSLGIRLRPWSESLSEYLRTIAGSHAPLERAS
ncbi:MAG: dTDP-4-dehydrorhamnose reductase [Chloroflexi bacterium]|nr:dTDP-4-dehydrorhamnose reductase [Chloroflexota bacterium]